MSLEERIAVRIAQVTAGLMREVDQVLNPFSLTGSQYNALRILNGAGADGLCGPELSARLISPAPDVPRLLDRLAEAGWIARERDPDNRRFVRARITPEGVERLIESAPAVAALHDRQLQSLSREQRETLLALLDQLGRSA
ncbi:MAG TPA: MarR family transcriptional regulator [Gemmatimonadales bacterium]|nr:MarR family transcriptional regulator [Gemmatimonadales bacterium]